MSEASCSNQSNKLTKTTFFRSSLILKSGLDDLSQNSPQFCNKQNKNDSSQYDLTRTLVKLFDRVRWAISSTGVWNLCSLESVQDMSALFICGYCNVWRTL